MGSDSVKQERRPEKGEPKFVAAICIDKDYDEMDSGIVTTEPNPQRCRYQDLWCSVIINAIYDAKGGKGRSTVPVERRQAILWLRGELRQQDLRAVCAMANIDAGSVMSWARKEFRCL